MFPDVKLRDHGTATVYVLVRGSQREREGEKTAGDRDCKCKWLTFNTMKRVCAHMSASVRACNRKCKKSIDRSQKCVCVCVCALVWGTTIIILGVYMEISKSRNNMVRSFSLALHSGLLSFFVQYLLSEWGSQSFNGSNHTDMATWLAFFVHVMHCVNWVIKFNVIVELEWVWPHIETDTW